MNLKFSSKRAGFIAPLRRKGVPFLRISFSKWLSDFSSKFVGTLTKTKFHLFRALCYSIVQENYTFLVPSLGPAKYEAIHLNCCCVRMQQCHLKVRVHKRYFIFNSAKTENLEENCVLKESTLKPPSFLGSQFLMPLSSCADWVILVCFGHCSFWIWENKI